MSTGLAVFLVGLVVLLGVILGVLATLIVRGRRRTRAAIEELLGREAAVFGPESASYRGGTGGFPGVQGNGSIVLTTERLAFRLWLGPDVDVPLAEITGVREAKTFRHERRGNRSHLIVAAGEAETGYLVGDISEWRAQILAAAPGAVDDGPTAAG